MRDSQNTQLEAQLCVRGKLYKIKMPHWTVLSWCSAWLLTALSQVRAQPSQPTQQHPERPCIKVTRVKRRGYVERGRADHRKMAGCPT